MRLRLFRLRLPLAIFIILILASCVIGYAILYSTLMSYTSNLREDYFRLESKYLKIEFPKSWFAMQWEAKNESSGNSYTVLLAPVNLHAVMFFRVYDVKATQTYMNENGLSDAFSTVIFEVNRLYSWSLQNNNNATLLFNATGTMTVSNFEANYTIITIIDGYKEDDTLFSLTGIFISWVDGGKLIQIIFYGKQEDLNQTGDVFWVILNSTRT